LGISAKVAKTIKISLSAVKRWLTVNAVKKD
jgi:hypothetical protein